MTQKHMKERGREEEGERRGLCQRETQKLGRGEWVDSESQARKRKERNNMERGSKRTGMQ